MVTIHEGLSENLARLSGRGDHRIHFGEREGEGLFAKHMFSGAQGFDRPFGMQVIGQGIVDHINFGIGEERLVTAMCARDFPLARVSLSGGNAPRSDGQ